jgi:hypothetical protein
MIFSETLFGLSNRLVAGIEKSKPFLRNIFLELPFQRSIDLENGKGISD